MNELALRRPSFRAPWPMTHEAWLTLVDEVAILRADVASQTGELDDGVVDFAGVKAARRLEVLSAVLELAERVDDLRHAVIGRRVTIVESGDEPAAYELVFPGDGDPAQGRISADSPLGSAVLRCEPGQSVEVAAPAGRRMVTLLSVE